MPSSDPAADLPRWTALLAGWRAGEGPLPVRLAAQIRAAIERGELRPGDRLPAERPLAALLGVSRATVVTALDDLTAGGWLRRRVGSGTRVSATAPRAAPVLTLRTPVGGAQPAELDFTIAVPLLSDAQREQLRDASADAFRESVYHPHGLPDLRARLAELYTIEGGLPTTPEQVVVTSGAQQAIALIAATLLRRGDAALLETPTYFGAIDVFRAAGAALVGVPVLGGGLNPDTFMALAREHGPRLAFLTPTYQNPTGGVLPLRARERLAAFVQQAKLPTIEDDTLLDLGFSGDPPPPRLAALAPAAPIITVGSLSKLYWAGLRVGWMRLPPGLAAPLGQAKTLADFGGSLPAQHAALHLLRDPEALRRQRREAVTPARDLLATLLRTELPDWAFELPGGGQFLWVTLPTPDASRFTHHAARHGLRLFPGAAMSVTPLSDQYLRLPFTLDPARLPEAVRRLRDAWVSFQGRSGSERLA
ncbi:PLP-dependent aminotransferase family protein [Deinococcus sp. HMF7604]|uniref:aminotransferase-like domain-containing protein n=1 Tax=Deinococcus betulae TaxID=2873312 RepID=UPI001CCBA07C|nr:PLP-dependent aminotransferase family protein [Deinococcus betulae]MBZ9751851.1 PLP-dependent aminotransferase family protein [Deinococcus betulae]